MPLPSISVVICCYNSAERLPETLRRLQAQLVPPDLSWEVILVDNASTDKTAAIAETVWNENPVTQLRVATEAEPGLSHARARGAAEAQHSIVALVDDDNWTPQHWLKTVAELFRDHSAVGVVGGPTTEACASDEPEWFQAFKGHYAVYALDSDGGEVEQAVCGAGLCYRRRAWQQLMTEGYTGILTDRKGKELTSGGDVEICAALRLNGWKIWYDPRLLIEHFIPTERLNWDYLTRLNRGFGKQSVYLDAYYALLPGFSRSGPAGSSWWRESLKALRALVGLMPQVMLKSKVQREGNAAWLVWQNQLARLQTLWREKRAYGERFKTLREAPWNHLSYD